ncbi:MULTISPECIES: protein-disulfide reductase DsbD [unclassified Janthinobacterium]|uniref:protein-disulfide reductase DsbD family protein n=1 Tax=unclassified Janthinobacterium TaxID=2610881 RepID=UPI00160E11BF|nr:MULTISPECIES: thioredoxin family protein [unclassified Janthinobacterium]MBB5609449.1 thiol:disulfide interchange protein DsbD [Janthinobacterium sp. S3T4]MBB5614704.1 thiol:disulfide interchange protein DsbD [Janthinobacterium sp. S3M3]
MLTILAAAFLGGLILNFMPCVFPVISLKAFGLIRHVHDRRTVRIEGLAFLAGVVVTMLLLGAALLAARAGGSAVGWGFQLQSPVLIAALSLIMLGSALNLMGVFEFGLAAQRIGGVAGPKSGPLGAALTGALAIIVATPCTAPFMAGAIGAALVRPPLEAMSIFLALALGFAAPFTAVSLVPACARLLPKPGAWMVTLKQVLAFPMLAAAAWLAWVLAQQAGSAALGVLLASSVVLGFAAWLYGVAQQRQFSGRRHRPQLAISILLVLGLAVPLAGLPTTSDGGSTANTMAATNTAPDKPVKWTPQAIVAERGHGKPVFVNFTASWCITCQVNDKAALSTKAVKDAMMQTGTVYMIADSTKYNADIDKAISEFGRGGLPVYVVYPADGGEPVLLPQLLSPDIVTAALEKAAKKHS